MPKPGYGPSADPRMKYFLGTVDSFARSMKARLRKSPPRTWAQYWRIWSDEQLLSRQQQMRLLINPHGQYNRNEDWVAPEERERTLRLLREPDSVA